MAADEAAAPRRPLVVSIVGTRPEAIKMAPVLKAIAALGNLRQELILTGQHNGIQERLDAALAAVRKLDLDLSEQTPGEIQETLRDAIGLQLLRRRPGLVLVQGDTSSALAGALAARDCGIPVGHVEAGLRSGNLQQPWPEEGNRIRIDSLSALLFAPTEKAATILIEEGASGEILLTGNTGIDALLEARPAYSTGQRAEERKTVLVTCHRRENWPSLDALAEALRTMVRQLPLDVVFVLHSNPSLRSRATALLDGEPHIRLLDPVAYEEMVALMDRAWAILTDSGGLQEEGPALGRPVLVLRNVTERSEALDSGNIALVGTDPNKIVAAAAGLLSDARLYSRMATPNFPFGDGRAAPRIAAAVEQFLARRPCPAAGSAGNSRQETTLSLEP